MSNDKEEDFIIAFQDDRAVVDVAFGTESGRKIWRWITKGSQRLLDLSVEGLTSAAERVRFHVENNLDGEWRVNEL